MDSDWTGKVVRETKDVVDMGWTWADPNCKSKRYETWTYRLFYTDPLPPKTVNRFHVKLTGEGKTIVCYSNGEYLISVEPEVTTRIEYVPSLWDRIKALFKR